MSLSTGLVQRRKRAEDEFSNEEFLKNSNSNSEQESSSASKARKSSNDNDKSDYKGSKGPQSNDLTLLEEVLLLGLKDNQGYLSFWNDNISYVLRGCILMELSLRNRIGTTKESRRRPFQDRIIEVIDDKPTGESLLDETLRLIKGDKQSVGNWIDLLSGETWNLMKIGYQLKQVRERIAKGLVDKGVLRTEKKNFVLFDMATHPLNDGSVKQKLIRRTSDCLMGRGPSPEARTICMICAAHAGNVLENVTNSMSFANREAALTQVDTFYKEFTQMNEKSKNLCLTEIIIGVLNVYTKMDTIV